MLTSFLLQQNMESSGFVYMDKRVGLGTMAQDIIQKTLSGDRQCMTLIVAQLQDIAQSPPTATPSSVANGQVDATPLHLEFTASVANLNERAGYYELVASYRPFTVVHGDTIQSIISHGASPKHLEIADAGDGNTPFPRKLLRVRLYSNEGPKAPKPTSIVQTKIYYNEPEADEKTIMSSFVPRGMTRLLGWTGQ